jgi:hypothetical protein
MKKILFSILIVLNIMTVQSQITETEPNNPFPVSNDLDEGVTVTGEVCTFENLDIYRIILPADGQITINTSVAAQGDIAGIGFEFRLYNEENNPWDPLIAAQGQNGAFENDSRGWCCLLADTFYLQVYSPYVFEYCFDYTLSWDFIPATFNNDVEPNSTIDQALDLAYNIPMEGHLSFVNQAQAVGSDGYDYYRITPPTNGTVRVFYESEAQSTGSNYTNMTLYNSSGAGWYSQNSPVGTFQAPNSDTIIWTCVGNNEMYISVATGNFFDRGYAYRIWYDVVSPIYENDIESNNSFATAQLVDPALPIEGNQYFFGDGAYDYFKFFKPDTGFFKVVIRAETYTGDATSGHSMQLFDHNMSPIGAQFTSPLGVFSIPAVDSVTYDYLAADTFYIAVYSNYAYAACRSYQLDLFYHDNANTIDKSEFSNLKVYPNPSNGTFIIDNGHRGDYEMMLYNSSGMLMHSEIIRNERQHSFAFDDLSNGIYSVHILQNDRRSIMRIMISK